MSSIIPHSTPQNRSTSGRLVAIEQSTRHTTNTPIWDPWLCHSQWSTLVVHRDHIELVIFLSNWWHTKKGLWKQLPGINPHWWNELPCAFSVSGQDLRWKVMEAATRTWHSLCFSAVAGLQAGQVMADLKHAHQDHRQLGGGSGEPHHHPGHHCLRLCSGWQAAPRGQLPWQPAQNLST